LGSFFAQVVEAFNSFCKGQHPLFRDVSLPHLTLTAGGEHVGVFHRSQSGAVMWSDRRIHSNDAGLWLLIVYFPHVAFSTCGELDTIPWQQTDVGQLREGRA
jgi:hypothetical protein